MTPTFSQPAAAQSTAQSTDRTILEAALEVFAERGYAAATTREIASRAGVNVAALNYHYRGKDKLWLAVCQDCSDRVAATVAAAIPAQPTPSTVLESVLGALFDSFVADARPVRILAWALLQADSLNFEGAAEKFQPMVDLCFGYVRALQKDGLLGDVDMEVVIGMVQGMLILPFLDQPGHRRFFQTDFSDPAHAARWRRQLIRAAFLVIEGAP